MHAATIRGRLQVAAHVLALRLRHPCRHHVATYVQIANATAHGICAAVCTPLACIANMHSLNSTNNTLMLTLAVVAA
jgi:hypothetical protein